MPVHVILDGNSLELENEKMNFCNQYLVNKVLHQTSMFRKSFRSTFLNILDSFVSAVKMLTTIIPYFLRKLTNLFKTIFPNIYDYIFEHVF